MKRIFLIIIWCLSFFMSGCSLQKKEEKSLSVTNFPERYVNEIGKIKFETDIIVKDNNQKKFFGGKAKPKSLNTKKIPDNLYVQEDYMDYSESDIWKEKFDKYIKQDLTRNTLEQFDKKNPKILRELEKNMKEIGVSQIKMQKATKIENEQNSYLMTGRQVYQEIPIIDPHYLYSTEDAGAPIRILYSNNEIKKMQVLYNYEIESDNTEIELVPFEKIVESLEEHFELIITDNSYIVKEAELCFMIDINTKKKAYDMVPVWLFSVYETTNMNKQRNFYEIIRADTAKRMVIE